MASNGLGYTLTGLTFNGTELQRTDLSVHLEVTKGLDEAPSGRGRDTVIPHLVGQVSRAYIADTLDIELFGMVQGDGATETLRRGSFRTIAEELKVLFQPGNEATLSGLGFDGQTYSITAKAVGDALRWGPQDIPGYRALTVLLIATDPYWATEGGGS